MVENLFIESTSTPGFIIRKAGKSHFEEILRLLHNNFDEEETMIKSLRTNRVITKEDEDTMALDHERLYRAMFSNSPFLIAIREDSEQIIGVNAMILTKNPKTGDSTRDESNIFSINQPRAALLKEYFRYLEDISEEANLYDKFPKCRAALEFYAIAVEKDYRRMGVSQDLMTAGVSLAKSLQEVDLVFGVYTSNYSKRAAEKVGLTSVFDVDLLNYKNSRGQPIFQDTPPHNIVSTMVLEI